MSGRNLSRKDGQPKSLSLEVPSDHFEMAWRSPLYSARSSRSPADFDSYGFHAVLDDHTGNRSPSAGVAAKTPRAMARAMVAPAAA